MWQPTLALATAPGLSVTQVSDGKRLTLILQTECPTECVLHWGLTMRPGGPWHCPPREAWPAGTTAVDGHAARTPFRRIANGKQELRVELELPFPRRHLVALVFCPRENRWIKNGGKDFCIDLPRQPGNLRSPEEALAAWVPGAEVERRNFVLDSGDRLAAVVRVVSDTVQVSLVSDAPLPVRLHWGLAPRYPHEWVLPGADVRPQGSAVVGAALQTPFAPRDGMQWLQLTLPLPEEGPGPRGLRGVLYQPDENAWLKSDGKDLFLPLGKETPDVRLTTPLLRELADQIIGAEVGATSWTLMHRYQLCYELLGRTQDDGEGLALLFAWLRYSANRQLDWQRNYNTKPRELAAVQDRLTRRLAALWKRARPEARLWPRLLLTTLGRGGDGQRVRDEILHIMHRNHLKETKGNFIEEWHQKLHNNTTPDDVVICEAYLAYLHANGDRGMFYRTLEAKGVTRDRLRSFERPIQTEPDFYGDRKDALIREFDNFLHILKAVHSGTDLSSAAGAARGRLNGEANRKLDVVFSLRQRRAPIHELTGAIVALREELGRALAATGDDGALRDLLYLDLAVEEALRSGVEQQGLSRFDREALVELVDRALRSLAATVDDEELRVLVRDWCALRGRTREGRDGVLQARSVTERAGRWVQNFTDELYRKLQPKAELLGDAFRVPQWAAALFSEEVVRGGPAFSLSLLLRHLDPLLRQSAGMGGWQVISPAQAVGRLRVVDDLVSVQHERFAEPTVLIADRVSGEEEVPAGVLAVLTRDTPDLVSHVAVRARNAHVLFATCFDGALYPRLKEMQGKLLALRTTPSGDVEHHEASAADMATSALPQSRGRPVRRQSRRSEAWVVAPHEFNAEVVGGKSNNLNGLRGRLSAEVGLPASLALPFGVCERVLEDETNRSLLAQYKELTAAVDTNSPEVLRRLRCLIVGLKAPAALQEALLAAWRNSGLPSIPWDSMWHGIRRVWASKWNERAYLSRRACGMAHEDLLMAVLIQQVVEADYAFVIHTSNPATGNRGELYAEVVLGMGETLVGNHPGRALGFVYRKADAGLEVVSYPSKSAGLYGRGVIFRSDSNGEDLEGFAGAGLYDSFLAEESQQRVLSYGGEKIVGDRGFREELLRRIARVGLEVESVLGSPQDIEGAVAGGKVHIVQTRPQVGLENQ